MEPVSPVQQIFPRLLLGEVRRRLLDESIPRLQKCLDLLPEEAIWHRPNAQSNAVGNLVLHLIGNVRQWILAGLLGETDTRQRQQEFDARGGWSRAELKAQLASLAQDLDEALDQIPAGALVREYAVQGFTESGIGILMHVVEHFSYHVGQVTYFTKAHLDVDTGYYAGENLDHTGK
ncbi:MAG: DUF1572 domain-containing protein [Bacteroidetes bacterium]|nr:MAG: DUF1572 domain-containing protein [Bacteroidota bacterium]